ncbi:hypothetical protein AB1Y20_005225 [Prymnesium parvum]|uniref:polynucleotide adenylyltransferase n=1 Tax=Prymnesium parvum TaxID=97485 RepID=A0AB34J588_PRYPA
MAIVEVMPSASQPLAYGVPTSTPARSEPLVRKDQTAAVTSNARRDRMLAADLGDFVSLCEPSSSTAPGKGARETQRPKGAAQTPFDGEGSKGDVWCPSRWYTGNSPLLQLHEDLLDFYEAYRPTAKEQAMRADLVKRVDELVGLVWPGASVRVFGSYSTGLYLPESDIDLVCIGTGLQDASKFERGKALHAFAAALRAAPWGHSRLEVIDKAKVPIVKFVDETSGVAVDVCIETRDGLLSASLATKANAQFPAYKVLVLVLKRFLHERGLHDTFTGGVGSYLLQLMVICSLQNPCNSAATPRGNLGSCLLHFLELFGLRFNYERVGIALREGGSFFDKFARGWANPARPHLLAVENPFDHSHDVGANSFNIYNVRRAFRHAYFSLQCMIGAGSCGAPSTRLPMLGVVLDIAQEMQSRFQLHALDAPAPTPTPAAAEGRGDAGRARRPRQAKDTRGGKPSFVPAESEEARAVHSSSSDSSPEAGAMASHASRANARGKFKRRRREAKAACAAEQKAREGKPSGSK